MSFKTEVMTATKQPNGIWKIAYDGIVLGDDRGFQTEELAVQEIKSRLKKDARNALIYGRPLLYVYEVS